MKILSPTLPDDDLVFQPSEPPFLLQRETKETERWLIVDTETDGLSDPIHVVEIAAQLMEGWDTCGEPFQIFLNHDVHIPRSVVAIHGYTQEFLRANGRPPLEAHEAFRQYAGELPIVAHNLGYDWNRALVPEWSRLGLKPVGCRGFCTVTLSRRVLPEANGYSLDELKSRFGLGDGPSHKARADVATVIRLFREILRPRLESSGLTTFEEWQRFAQRRPVSDCWRLIDPSRDAERQNRDLSAPQLFKSKHNVIELSKEQTMKKDQSGSQPTPCKRIKNPYKTFSREKIITITDTIQTATGVKKRRDPISIKRWNTQQIQNVLRNFGGLETHMLSSRMLFKIGLVEVTLEIGESLNTCGKVGLSLAANGYQLYGGEGDAAVSKVIKMIQQLQTQKGELFLNKETKVEAKEGRDSKHRLDMFYEGCIKLTDSLESDAEAREKSLAEIDTPGTPAKQAKQKLTDDGIGSKLPRNKFDRFVILTMLEGGSREEQAKKIAVKYPPNATTGEDGAGYFLAKFKTYTKRFKKLQAGK